MLAIMALFPPDVLFGAIGPSHEALIGFVALILAPTPPVPPRLLLQIAPGQLLDVVHQAIQPPLRAHLVFAAQREPVQPLVVPDVAKHRLHRADALAVAPPSLWAVDALLHRLQHVVRTGLPLGKDRHLPHRRALVVA